MLKASPETPATTGRPSRMTAKMAPSASPSRPPDAACRPTRYDDPKVLARLAALPSLPMADLKQQWRDLFAAEPPPYNRKYIESRLAYRIQELAFGGLSEQTRKRLKAIGEDLEGAKSAPAGKRGTGGPIAGTRLVRDWQGTEHCVTVMTDGYEWQGRPYQSLSSVARAITGTRWNGWLFFGLKNQRAPAKGRAR